MNCISPSPCWAKQRANQISNFQISICLRWLLRQADGRDQFFERLQCTFFHNLQKDLLSNRLLNCHNWMSPCLTEEFWPLAPLNLPQRAPVKKADGTKRSLNCHWIPPLLCILSLLSLNPLPVQTWTHSNWPKDTDTCDSSVVRIHAAVAAQRHS